jgi:hypothetical protein
MDSQSAGAIYNPKIPFAVMISSSVHPRTLENLNDYHKDPTYELVSGTREAYFLKKLAGKLSHNVAESEDVQNLSALIQDAARELERSWRMASCISNTPVSTGYPYLPIMPSVAKASSASTGATSGDTAAASKEAATPTGNVKSETAIKGAGMTEHFPLLSVPLPYSHLRRKLMTSFI